MDIDIKNPINLKIELVEIDDYIPSVKTKFSVELEHPTGTLKYNANDIWFDCANWASFIKSLQKIQVNQLLNNCLLKDMSEQLSIEIKKEDNNLFHFHFHCLEPIYNNEKATFNFSKEIKTEELHNIKNEFEEFEELWK